MKARTRKGLLIGLGVFAVAVLALVLCFDAIVTWQTRKGLDSIEGYKTTFSDVELRPLKLTYAIRDLKMMKETAGGAGEPFFYAEEIEGGVYWRELLDGHLVARVRVESPKVTLIAAKDKKEQQLEPEDPNLAEKLEEMVPLKVDRIEIKSAEVDFIDKTEPEFPEIWLHDADVTVENFATRASLSKGEPTIVAASGTLQKSGQVSLYVTADPLAKGLSFSGSFKLEGLDMREFGKLIRSKSGVVLKKGKLDLFAQFDARDGHISGGVKPLLKNPEVEQAEPGLVNKLKAVVADAGLKLFSDRVDNRDAVATVIPLDGQIKDPEVQLWPTVFGVIRNAFVEGVSESFSRLPPPTAEKDEGIVTQARRALSKDRGPPKAQPTEGAKAGAEVEK
jgi:hypothetical protein